MDNVVEAIQCALERGEGGHAYFVTDPEPQTFRAFAGFQGLSVDKLRTMPYWFASTAGRLLDVLWAVLRREGDPPISRSMMRMIGPEFRLVSGLAAIHREQ